MPTFSVVGAAHLRGMNLTDTTTAHAARRRLALIIAAAVIVVLVAGVGIYGLITGPRTPASDDPPAPSSSAPSGPDHRPDQLREIPETSDPQRFARRVAEALFTWDTGSGWMPLDYTSVLLEVADPTGVEQAGLAADIATYFPSREAWVELRKYQTRQWIDIAEVFVPQAWAEAESQANPGQLPPGASAYTIEGTRHRDGIWHDETVTSEHEVAFTVFIACPPDEACYLLRLSMLDTPLQ